MTWPIAAVDIAWGIVILLIAIVWAQAWKATKEWTHQERMHEIDRRYTPDNSTKANADLLTTQTNKKAPSTCEASDLNKTTKEQYEPDPLFRTVSYAAIGSNDSY
jgi:hypothetical protein